MRKLLGVAVLAAWVGIAIPAAAVTTDGDWSDWFTYGGNTSFNTWDENQVTLLNPNIRTQVDEEGPTPGGGGQLYDIEQIFYLYEDADPNALTGGTLHVGLVTGFPSYGDDPESLYAGDMFFDFGNTGGFDLAVATSTSNVNVDYDENGPASVDSAYFGNSYANTGGPEWVVRDPDPLVAQSPWRVERNSAIENLIASTVAWGGQGVHHFLEISIAVDGGLEDILTNEDGGLGLHWTMECGNDVIIVQDDSPLAPIPEPSTFALLGMGMLGVALRKKFTA